GPAGLNQWSPRMLWHARPRLSVALCALGVILAACSPAAPASPTAWNPASASAPGRSEQATAAKPIAGTEKPATIRVGLIPNHAPDKIKAQYQPFQDYLSKTLNQPIELFVATDYAGVVEAMA